MRMEFAGNLAQLISDSDGASADATGAAILKRVVPFAAGVAVIMVLVRRFRHLLRRGARKG